MKNKFLITCCLFLLIGVSEISAQAFSKGYIRYTPTTVETSDLRLKTMLTGSTFDVYFSSNRQKVDVKMMDESVRFQFIADSYMETGMMLTEGLVGKLMVKSSRQETKQEIAMPKYTITYDKNDRKKIAGYDCYKATLDFGKEKMVAYVTDKIKPDLSFLEDIIEEMIAFPLEMQVNVDGNQVVFTAESVSKSFSQSVFSPDTAGYKELTPDEIEQTFNKF
ncbi:MAG: hypothetical protein AAFV80_20805 [Bacteroidota bacterium]